MTIKRNLGLLTSLVVFCALCDLSTQEFYWKNNKIVRQYQMTNNNNNNNNNYQSPSSGYQSGGSSSSSGSMGGGYSSGGSGGYQSGGASSGSSSYQSGGGSSSGGSSYPSGGSSSGQIEPWRQFVQQNEQFSCQGKQDGFYSSRWCNVFYRCFYGIKTEFLCAIQTNGDRLWWTAHSTSQDTPQQSAQCVFPCAQNRQCTSPGGVLKDTPPVSESTSDAQRILSSCPANVNYGPGSPGQNVPDNSNDQFRLPDQTNYCQGVPDGSFVANPNYCNIFHVCVGGNRKDFECAKDLGGTYDLWWNDATKRCDYPCLLQCSKGIYGSSMSAPQVQQSDAQVNVAICGGGSSSSGNGGYPSGGGSSGGYPSGGSSGGYPSGGSSGGYPSGGSSGGYPSGGSSGGYPSGSSNNYQAPSNNNNNYQSPSQSNSNPSPSYSNSYPSTANNNNNYQSPQAYNNNPTTMSQPSYNNQATSISSGGGSGGGYGK